MGTMLSRKIPHQMVNCETKAGRRIALATISDKHSINWNRLS